MISSPEKVKDQVDIYVTEKQTEYMMTIDKEQLRGMVKEVLEDMDLCSKSAVELLMVTMAVESRLGTYLEQIGGPAQGVLQMEPATEEDIWQNYLKYNPELAAKVMKYVALDSEFNLRGNLPYQIAIGRVHYLRRPEKLPSHDDIGALAQYWKDHWNTYKGAGTVEKAIEAYEEHAL